MTRPIIIAILLLVLGFFLLALFLVRLIRRLSFRQKSDTNKKIPAGVGYLAIFFSILLLILSWILFRTNHQLRSFRPFISPGNIGQIEARYEGDPVKTLKIEFYSTGADSITAPTAFYLSGNALYVKGQSVKIPAFLTYIFQWQTFYKVTDFYGEFIGHKPPGIDKPILAHQEIGGGPVNTYSLLGFLPIIKNVLDVCEFESKPIKIDNHVRYNLVLADSCRVSYLKK